MTRRTSRAVAVLGALALAASCGGDADVKPAPRPADVAPSVPPPEVSTEAARTVPPAPAHTPTYAPSMPPAEIDALVAALQEAKGLDAVLHAQVALVDGGAPVLDLLLARLGDPDRARREAALGAIRHFGADAVRGLVALLESKDRMHGNWAAAALVPLKPWWIYDDVLGPIVCRALMARLAADPDPSCSLHDPLGYSRPAGRSIAAEVPSLWRRPGQPVGTHYHGVFCILASLGSDAGPAAQAVVRALADAAARGECADDAETKGGDTLAGDANLILEAIGSADPSILADLRRFLADGQPPALRTAIAGRVVPGWGDAAAAAAPELRALLRCPDRTARVAAAEGLASMPSVADDVWRDLVAAFAQDIDPRPAVDALTKFARDPAFASRLASALPSLAPGEMPIAFAALSACGSFDVSQLWQALFTHGSPVARRLALRTGDHADGTHAPLPIRALTLLDDPDVGVRAAAAALFAATRAAPDARIVTVATAALGSAPDLGARIDAVRALAAMADRSPTAMSAAAAALDDSDPAVRDAALLALSACAETIPGSHPAAIADASLRVYVKTAYGPSGAWKPFAGALLRMNGGAKALEALIGSHLAPGAAAGNDWDAFDRSVELATFAGPRVAAVRPKLVAVRAATGGDWRTPLIDRAIAAIDANAEAIALAGALDADTVRRLLALGAPGRAALPLLAARDWQPDRFPLALLDGVRLTDEIVAASRAAAPDAHAVERRRGAAVLASELPPSSACGVLTSLVADADEATSLRAARSLRIVEERTPGTVPVAVVAGLLTHRSSPTQVRKGLPIAVLLGPRAAVLVPDLRRLRDAGPADVTALATVALWRITGRADEALPALRSVLARPELALGVDWKSAGLALSELPIAATDIPALVRTVQIHAGSECAAALVPLLERFGPAAAPAVPTLRTFTRQGPAVAAARVLGAIGAAAREALPDLYWLAGQDRAWLLPTSDSRDVVRDAIAKIESAPR